MTTNDEVARKHFNSAVWAVGMAEREGSNEWALISLAHIGIAKFAQQSVRRLSKPGVGRESE